MLNELARVGLMILTLAFALIAVELKNISYAILSFYAMCIAVGATCWLLDAWCVTAFQSPIYAGAIVALFISAVILTRRKEIVN